MKHVKLISAIVASLLLLVVILQNTASVETRVLGATITMPRAILLGTCMILGFGLGVLTCLYLVRRKDPRRSGGESAARSGD